jgi:hypothetical protein
MSRNTDKIAKALKEKGWEAEEIIWEPIGIAMEMCGPDGGWTVRIKDDNNQLGNYYLVLGYNIQEVLEEIKKLPEAVTAK